MDYKIVVVGNALVDLLIRLSDNDPSVAISQDKSKLCLTQGEKILAEDIVFVTGGGAPRVGISISRLGSKVGILSEIGEDELSERIIKDLNREGIETKHIVRGTKPTNFTVGINYRSDRTLLIHHTESKHKFDLEKFSTEWFYVASLSLPWKTCYGDLLSFSDKNNVKIAFNPGPAQLNENYDSYSKIIEKSEVLFVNKQEAQTILDTEESDIPVLLNALKGKGPEVVVITNGRFGAYGIDSKGLMLHAGIFDSEVIERTGAGDAFAAGFLARYFYNNDLKECLTWGTFNSSQVITKQGGLDGLMHKKDMQEFYDMNKNKLSIKEL